MQESRHEIVFHPKAGYSNAYVMCYIFPPPLDLRLHRHYTAPALTLGFYLYLHLFTLMHAEGQGHIY